MRKGARGSLLRVVRRDDAWLLPLACNKFMYWRNSEQVEVRGVAFRRRAGDPVCRLEIRLVQRAPQKAELRRSSQDQGRLAGPDFPVHKRPREFQARYPPVP